VLILVREGMLGWASSRFILVELVLNYNIMQAVMLRDRKLVSSILIMENNVAAVFCELEEVHIIMTYFAVNAAHVRG